jgi:hypothetical protein
VIPGARTFLREPEGSVAKCSCKGRWEHIGVVSSKLGETDQSSLPIDVEEGLGRRSAIAEAILWEEQETKIIMFMISCLLLANY